MAYIIIEVEKTDRRFQLCAEILGKKRRVSKHRARQKRREIL